MRQHLWARGWVAVAMAVALVCSSASVASAGGFSNAQVARLTQAVRGAMTRQGYPGIDVGIWQPGKHYVRAFGLADTVDARPMRIGDRFRVGSITRLQFIETGEPYDYGLGIMRVGDFCGHNGLIFGYDSAMFYSAQSRTAIVVLANQTPLLDSPPLKRPSDTANLAVVLLRIALASSPRHATATSSPC